MNKKLSTITGIAIWLIFSIVIGSAGNLVPAIDGISDKGDATPMVWNGNQWPVLVAGNPVAIRGNIYSVDGAAIRINLFVKGTDGKLWERFWDGGQWIWANTGLPVAGNPVILVRGNTGSVNEAGIRINLFVRGADGKLWERYWSGNNWIWANTGMSVASDPVILVRGNIGSVDNAAIRINLFVKGADGKLWERYWNGNYWIWANTGLPTLVASNPVVVVRGNFYSVNGAAIKINMFVKGTDGKLWERYWNGNNWIWANTGLPTATGMPTENISGMPTENVSGMPTENVTGMPTENVTGMPEYTI